MLKISIITEGGRDIGLGHITRCISLYQGLKERNLLPYCIVNGDRSIEGLLDHKGCEVFDWLKERKKLFSFLQGMDIAIIDSYLADVEFYKEISRVVKIPVYIDDNKRLDYPRGLIINGAVNAEDLGYPKNKGMGYLLGTRYVLLREDFWDVPEKKIKDNIESVLVTFSVNDPRNMTPKVLKTLIDHYPDLAKRVMIGKGFKNRNEIKKFKDKKTEFIYNPDAEVMKRAALESDIAISAGGQTLFEFARCGIPAVVIAIVDNQLNNIKGLEKAGFIENAGWWEDKSLDKKITASIDRLKDMETRSKKSAIGRQIVDGQGSLRVCDTIINKDVPVDAVTRFK